ncbi:MAG: ferritin family protein [Armatimonadetes bacterium]|jgi:rubrerythrin|nr:ferritin family protein [Armatimonadota bacterium]MDI9603187.1 ferritin family protein [Acidobacteriota bacterium]NLN88811.1 ferritin family protein [candidate division WS1 bacterium]
MPASKKDVLDAAIQLENDGRDYFLEAASKSSNDVVRKVLESLAEDELRHISWIQQHYPEAKSAEQANREFYQRLSGLFADVAEEEKEKVAASEDDLKALDHALSIEYATSKAYKDWAADAEDPEVVELCRILAGVEHFHAQLIENTIQYLKKPGDWFMQEERWFFEGG